MAEPKYPTPFSVRAEAGAGPQPISRRAFLQGVAAALAWLAANRPARAQAASGGAGIPPAPVPAVIAEEPGATLAVVQEHLFPSEPQAPGAMDIHATSYLHDMLDLPDAVPEEKDLILQGAQWLNIEVDHQYPGKRFADLTEDQREEMLIQIAGSGAGQRWVMLLLYYIIEALLTDPIYGGNPGGIGWQWLKHTPGFPQPTLGTRYFDLQQR